jgi:hypothetical protein
VFGRGSSRRESLARLFGLGQSSADLDRQVELFRFYLWTIFHPAPDNSAMPASLVSSCPSSHCLPLASEFHRQFNCEDHSHVRHSLAFRSRRLRCHRHRIRPHRRPGRGVVIVTAITTVGNKLTNTSTRSATPLRKTASMQAPTRRSLTMASEKTWRYAPSPMMVVTTIIGLARGLGINAIAEDKPVERHAP